MLDTPGISYLRTTREDTPRCTVPMKSSRWAGASSSGRAVGPGPPSWGPVTVFGALQAADLLGEEYPVRVIDAYSVKPIDVRTLRRALEETGLMVVVEDHWRKGGLASAALEALAGDGAELSGRLLSLAVDRMPGSASPQEQRKAAGISAEEIAQALGRYLR